MSTATIRDWRGIKHHPSQYSTAELIGVLTCAQHTHEQVAQFIEKVEAELALRGAGPEPSAA